MLKLSIAALALCLLGCESHGGADYRYVTPPDTGTPVPPPVYTPPGPTAEAGGCSNLAALSVDGKSVCAILSTFGTPQEDYAFQSEVNIQASWWNYSVRSVWMIKECAGINAFSTSDHDIAFGTNAYHQVRSQYGTMVGVQLILAHEWAHQVQFGERFFVPQVPVRVTELEADMFAGFYLSWARQFNYSQLAQALDLLHSLGSEAYLNKDFHGTPPERKYMGLLGYATAENYKSTGSPPSWVELHNIARREIGHMPLTILNGEEGVSNEQILDAARRAVTGWASFR